MASTSTSTELLKSKNGGRFGRELRKDFLFDEKWTNLNHGSFGTYPRAVRDALRSFQDAHEARPDHFIRYEYPKLLDQSRQTLSKYLNVPTSELVFVQNATTGVNIVLRNIPYAPNDYILFSATIYGGCEKAVAYITETTSAKAAKVDYTFPVEDDWLVDAFRSKIEEIEKRGGRVKVAVFDTVVSMPGVRLPYERLTELCREKGVLSLIDGAHGIGHVALDLKALDADFFVSNCHKWLHAPRGCAIFHVPQRNQHLIRSTMPTSHGFVPAPVPPFAGSQNNPFPPAGAPKSAFELNFEFTGTVDASPYLCVPAALEYRQSIGGEDTIREYCFALSLQGTTRMAELLGTEVLDNSTGTLTQCCMAMVALPLEAEKMHKIGADKGVAKGQVGIALRDWMSKTWIDDYNTFIQSMFYSGRWWLRTSAQPYLEMADYERAAEIAKEVCLRAEKGEWADGVMPGR